MQPRKFSPSPAPPFDIKPLPLSSTSNGGDGTSSKGLQTSDLAANSTVQTPSSPALNSPLPYVPLLRICDSDLTLTPPPAASLFLALSTFPIRASWRLGNTQHARQRAPTCTAAARAVPPTCTVAQPCNCHPLGLCHRLARLLNRAIVILSYPYPGKLLLDKQAAEGYGLIDDGYEQCKQEGGGDRKTIPFKFKFHNSLHSEAVIAGYSIQLDGENITTLQQNGEACMSWLLCPVGWKSQKN
nr:hypothetical protein Iba_chr14fCG8090 [Ipomoea batatas]